MFRFFDEEENAILVEDVDNDQDEFITDVNNIDAGCNDALLFF